jgi:alanyl-tRNA synthetase
MIDEQTTDRKQIGALRSQLALDEFNSQMRTVHQVNGIPVLSAKLDNCDADTLRRMTDQFRRHHPGGIVVLGSVLDGRPIIVASVHDDLLRQGFSAIDLVKHVSRPLGGGGGGKPTLAQAGGKDGSKLDEALQSVEGWVKEKTG